MQQIPPFVYITMREWKENKRILEVVIFVKLVNTSVQNTGRGSKSVMGANWLHCNGVGLAKISDAYRMCISWG